LSGFSLRKNSLIHINPLYFLSHNDEFFVLSVPLVSRVLPSDICKIHKSGASIRMDTTLVDFNDMRWERGDISFIFNGDQKPSHSLTVLDNKAKLFQRVRYEVNNLFKSIFSFPCFLYVYAFVCIVKNLFVYISEFYFYVI